MMASLFSMRGKMKHDTINSGQMANRISSCTQPPVRAPPPMYALAKSTCSCPTASSMAPDVCVVTARSSTSLVCHVAASTAADAAMRRKYKDPGGSAPPCAVE